MVAALGALLIHLRLPNGQSLPVTWMDPLPSWQHPYPLLLANLLAISFLVALLQAVWRPSRPWVRHYAPLLAAAIVLLSVSDPVTQQLNWMALPYFPGPDIVLGSVIEDRGILLESTGRSLLLLLSGYLLGVIAGIATGVLIGWFPRARYWGMPILKVVGPIPATALIPLVMTL